MVAEEPGMDGSLQTKGEEQQQGFGWDSLQLLLVVLCISQDCQTSFRQRGNDKKVP